MFLRAPETVLASILTLMILLFSSDSRAGTAGPSVPPVELYRVFPSLTFDQPVELHQVPDGSGKLVMAEREGRLIIFDKIDDPKTTSVYLDISSRVETLRDQGLYSFAFDPLYPFNPYIYLHYANNSADPGIGTISRFTVQAGRVSAASEEKILELPQPLRDHNGGSIAFGPDGMLYIAFGDGGSLSFDINNPPPGFQPTDFRASDDPESQDPFGNAQDTTNLFGSILRIDVHGIPEPGLNYAIPFDNPFVVAGPAGTSTRKEIYAYGFRNPWRIAFDEINARLFAADVGAKSREEIDEVVAGANYGWSEVEGDICFPPPPAAQDCNLGLFEPPIVVHEWQSNSVRSITGGYFYQAPHIPELQGTYIYADYVWGTVWGAAFDGSTATTLDLLPPGTNSSTRFIAGFGDDLEGEVYTLYFNTGEVYTLRPQGFVPSPTATTPPPTTVGPTPTTPIPTPSPTPIPRAVIAPLFVSGSIANVGDRFQIKTQVIENPTGLIPIAADHYIRWNPEQVVYVSREMLELGSLGQGPILDSPISPFVEREFSNFPPNFDNENPTPGIGLFTFEIIQPPTLENPIIFEIFPDNNNDTLLGPTSSTLIPHVFNPSILEVAPVPPTTVPPPTTTVPTTTIPTTTIPTTTVPTTTIPPTTVATSTPPPTTVPPTTTPTPSVTTTQSPTPTTVVATTIPSTTVPTTTVPTTVVPTTIIATTVTPTTVATTVPTTSVPTTTVPTTMVPTTTVPTTTVPTTTVPTTILPTTVPPTTVQTTIAPTTTIPTTTAPTTTVPTTVATTIPTTIPTTTIPTTTQPTTLTPTASPSPSATSSSPAYVQPYISGANPTTAGENFEVVVRVVENLGAVAPVAFTMSVQWDSSRIELVGARAGDLNGPFGGPAEPNPFPPILKQTFTTFPPLTQGTLTTPRLMVLDFKTIDAPSFDDPPIILFSEQGLFGPTSSQEIPSILAPAFLQVEGPPPTTSTPSLTATPSPTLATPTASPSPSPSLSPSPTTVVTTVPSTVLPTTIPPTTVQTSVVTSIPPTTVPTTVPSTTIPTTVPPTTTAIPTTTIPTTTVPTSTVPTSIVTTVPTMSPSPSASPSLSPSPSPSPSASPSPTEIPTTTPPPTTAPPTATLATTVPTTTVPTTTVPTTVEPTASPTETPEPTPTRTPTVSDIIRPLLGAGTTSPALDVNGDGFVDSADILALR